MSVAAADWPKSPFWAFSLELYGRPEVETACLALQDRHGFDVNLVLLACWAAHTGRRLDPALAAQARAIADRYQAEVMQPLRQVRRALKMLDPGTALASVLADRRRALVALELDLERLEQLRLERLLANALAEAASPRPELVLANLAALYPKRELPLPLLGPLTAELTRGTSSRGDKRRMS